MQVDMKFNNQEVDQNSQDSDDVYMSDDEGVRYVQDGEDFEAFDNDATDGEDKKEEGESVKELVVQIEKAKADAVISREDNDVKEARQQHKTRGAGDLPIVASLDQLKNMMMLQGTMIVNNGKVFNLDDNNLKKDFLGLNKKGS